MTDKPSKTCTLRFDKALFPIQEDLDAVRNNLSGLARHRNNLWLGGDEGTSLHRMTRDSDGNFGQHKLFDVRSLVQLPVNDSKAEIDVEGIDIDAGYLWLIGSHSLKRKKPEKNKTDQENLDRLADVKRDGNRFTLARLPLKGDKETEPVEAAAGLTPARLEGDTQSNGLLRALATDRHIGRFVSNDSLGIPSKDNGLDIEGLAVAGNRAFVGLRGPVLRGWGVILELQLGNSAPGVLTLDSFGAPGVRYRKYFLELDGLGIRDLAILDSDLYILTGPTMSLDGPAFLCQWKHALEQAADRLVWRQDLRRILSIPCGNPEAGTEGSDHPEGIALLKDPLSVMVCYDSPSAARLDGKDGVEADIFAL